MTYFKLYCTIGRSIKQTELLNLLHLHTRAKKIVRVHNNAVPVDIGQKLESSICGLIIAVHFCAWQNASLNDGQKSCRIPTVHHLEIASCGTMRTRDYTKHLRVTSSPSSPVVLKKILEMLLKIFFLIIAKGSMVN